MTTVSIRGGVPSHSLSNSMPSCPDCYLFRKGLDNVCLIWKLWGIQHLLDRFQEDLVIKPRQQSCQWGFWGIKDGSTNNLAWAGYWPEMLRGVGCVCTERLFWIFPLWQRAGQRHWGQHIEPRAHWQLLVWLWCTISVWHAAFSLPPPPLLH